MSGRAPVRFTTGAVAVLLAVALTAPTAHASPSPGPEAVRHPASAAPAVGSPEARAAHAAALDGAREQVRRIALSGLPAELRTSAWNALRHTGGDQAIGEWLAAGGGYDFARQRLRETRTRNRLFCERVVRTHAASFAPRTRSAAEQALKGTDADRSAFVRTGYARAQEEDRTVRETAAGEQRAVTEREREFVRSLARRDPGEQVRVAAQWALRPGASDADLREFHGYGWVTGGALDLEGYRLRTADEESLRHRVLAIALKTAIEAEDALPAAMDREAARAEALRAWRAVATLAGDARTAWQADRTHAGLQARNWGEIQEFARQNPDGPWQTIVGPAGENLTAWTAEERGAAAPIAFWEDLLRRAQDGQTRVAG
ncbi:hypothetical protein [Streptomyces sp. NPDC048606]|uniref:hypothetical protein n=1 Tax=Streptomyces sp. NPDC048606 TaxID=3154726 RepID=UPI00343B4316